MLLAMDEFRWMGCRERLNLSSWTNKKTKQETKTAVSPTATPEAQDARTRSEKKSASKFWMPLLLRT